MGVKQTLIFNFGLYIRVIYNLQMAHEEKLLGTVRAKFNRLALFQYIRVAIAHIHKYEI